jgi:coenzyme F420-0:L-glutamate ligase/coenzyme F420-1:gamma-L-glutamate ligase
VTGLQVLPVPGIGDVRPGDDLAAMITGAAPWLADGDVLVVTSKIVSKAEGRLVEVPVDGPERDAARDALLDRETARPVARRGPTRIVQTHHGFVLAAAGIDASNVDREHLVLLPADSDASARVLRAALRDRFGLDVAIVVSDTMGRPWRNGLTDVALGAAGIGALRDYRGDTDAYGNELQLTQMAVIDELSAAAELVKGKYDQVPVAVVRGLAQTGAPDGAGARTLIRDADQDLFSLGTAEAVAQGRWDAAELVEATGFAAAPVDPELVRGLVDRVGPAGLLPLDAGPRDKLRESSAALAGAAELVLVHAPAEPMACARAGAAAHRLRAAALASGLVSGWHPVDDPTDLVDLPGDEVVLGVLALGYPG